jgi:hypothetical protein
LFLLESFIFLIHLLGLDPGLFQGLLLAIFLKTLTSSFFEYFFLTGTISCSRLLYLLCPSPENQALLKGLPVPFFWWYWSLNSGPTL